MYNGQQPISIWLPALGTQQISHLTFYFHVSPWCPDHCGEKTNEINKIPAPRRFPIKTEWQGNRKVQQTRVAAHQTWVTCAEYTSLSPRDRKPIPLKHISLSVQPQCFPAPGYGSTRSQSREQIWLGPSPGPTGRAISLQKHLPSHTSLCVPPPLREWAASLPARPEGSTRITGTPNL